MGASPGSGFGSRKEETVTRMAKKSNPPAKSGGEIDPYRHANNRVSKDVEEASTKSGGGWGFLKLIQPTTKAQDEIEGLVPSDFLLGRGVVIKGGQDADGFVAVPVANRARATLWDRDAGTIIDESTDPTSELYASIRARRGDYGLEFLFWLPLYKQFGVLGFTKPTSRPLGAVVNDAMDNRQVVTITSKMISNKKGRFAVMMVDASDAKGKMEMPSSDVFGAVVADFTAASKEKDAPTNARPR